MIMKKKLLAFKKGLGDWWILKAYKVLKIAGPCGRPGALVIAFPKTKVGLFRAESHVTTAQHVHVEILD